MNKNTVIAVDLAKNVFQVAVSEKPGQVKSQRRLRRTQVLTWFAQRPAATVVMEACGSAHHWGRELAKLGHSPMLLPAHHLKAYVRGNKTDRTDAAGLVEAYHHAMIRPVPVKTLEQQATAGLHRMRSGWMKTRTARLNSLRGHFREYGVVIPVGAQKVRPRVREILSQTPCPFPEVLHPLVERILEELDQLEHDIALVERQLKVQSKESEEIRRLRTVPGIGLLTSTAVPALLGSPHRFPSGRHMSSFIGITPKEHSSGDRRRLGAITRQGDKYLRTLFIHGARSLISNAPRRRAEPDRLRQWALHLVATRGKNKAIVAVANKLVRIAWAVWAREQAYQPREALADY